MTYSQQDEQQFILANTPEIGRFLDIGAYHATVLSNVRALYDRGWSGVLVEPSPVPLRGLIQDYAGDDRVAVIGAAVGEHCGLVKIFASDGAYSTSRHENREQWDVEGEFYGEFWVPQITVESLIEQFGPFHFVSVDTEGTSFGIFRRLLATPMEPPCICTEHDGQLVQAVMAAQARGYDLVHENGCNAIFARRLSQI